MNVHTQRGVMLLEALIAILIFSVGILGLIAMQAQAVNFTADAKYRSDAAFLADEIIGQMWVDQTNLATYANPGGTAPALATWVAKVNSTLPGATVTAPTIAIAGTQVTVSVFWQPPSATSGHSYTVIATITPP